MFGRKSFFYLIVNLIASGLSFVGLFFMTRYLGTDVYGSVIWMMALMATINSVSDLGFSNAHIKRISEGQDLNDCVSTYAVIQIVLTGVMVVLTLSFIAVWTYFLGGAVTGKLLDILVLFILYYVLIDLANIAVITFSAKTETVKGQIITLVNPLIRIPLVIIVSIGQMSSIDLTYAYVLTALGVAVAALFLLQREHIRWKRPTLFGSYYKFALPIALLAIITAVSANLDRLLVGFFGNDTDVAYYASGQTFITIFLIVGSAVAILAFPLFSKMHAEGDLVGIREKTRQAERYISMIGMPVTVLIVLFPSEIATILLGPDFAAAGEPLRFMAMAMLLSLLNTAYNSQILATNNPGIYAKINIANFIINAVLLLIFIPTSLFGIGMLGLSYTGAAIADLLATAFLFLLTRSIVKRLTGTRSNPRILLHVAAAGIAGCSLLLLSDHVKMTGIVTLIGYGLFSVGVFAAVLWMMRELTLKDVHFFLDTVNPAKMFTYVSDEMHGKTSKP